MVASISDSLSYVNSESRIPFFWEFAPNVGMTTAFEIRHARLLEAIELAGTIEALASKAGVSPAYLSQLKNKLPDSKTKKPKGMGDAVARRIEAALKKSRGWMDARNEAPNDEISRLKADIIDELHQLSKDDLEQILHEAKSRRPVAKEFIKNMVGEVG